MKRSDIINNLINKNPNLNVSDAVKIVDTIINYMKQCVKEGKRIELRNFGVFSLVKKAARKGVNPKTGKVLDIPAKKAVHFKMGKMLFKKVNSKNSI